MNKIKEILFIILIIWGVTITLWHFSIIMLTLIGVDAGFMLLEKGAI